MQEQRVAGGERAKRVNHLLRLHLPTVIGRQQVAQEFEHARGMLGMYRQHHFFLAAEIQVDRSLGQTGGLCHLRDRREILRVAGDQRLGRLQDGGTTGSLIFGLYCTVNDNHWVGGVDCGLQLGKH